MKCNKQLTQYLIAIFRHYCIFDNINVFTWNDFMCTSVWTFISCEKVSLHTSRADDSEQGSGSTEMFTEKFSQRCNAHPFSAQAIFVQFDTNIWLPISDTI